MKKIIPEESYHKLQDFLCENRYICDESIIIENNIKQIRILNVKTFNLEANKKESYKLVLPNKSTDTNIFEIVYIISEILQNIDINVIDEKTPFINSFTLLEKIYTNIKHAIIKKENIYKHIHLNQQNHYYTNKIRSYLIKELRYGRILHCNILNDNDIKKFILDINAIIKADIKRFKFVDTKIIQVYKYIKHIIEIMKPNVKMSDSSFTQLKILLTLFDNISNQIIITHPNFVKYFKL